MNNSVIVNKNSINGFFVEEFINYFQSIINDIKDIVIIGVCTDLCVDSIAKNCLTAINQLDKNINVNVIINAVETYDLAKHDAEIINSMTFYSMLTAGIHLYKL